MQELSQLQTVVDNTSVVVSMDNRRELNLDDIIEEVRQEYETNAQRSRAEVDAMYQGRVSRLQQDREARLSAPRKRNPNCLFSSLTSVPGPSELVGKPTPAAEEQL